MSYRVETTTQQIRGVVNAMMLHSVGEQEQYFVDVSGGAAEVVKAISTSPFAGCAVVVTTVSAVFRESINVMPQWQFDWFEFQALVNDWRRERGATSSITKMAMCPAYQQIIAMGSRVIPLILRQMESEGDEPDMWFWALRALTKINPVSDADRGNVVRMAQAWLSWGRRGYAW